MVMNTTSRDVWLYPAMIWLGLLAMLAATIGAAYLGWGEISVSLNLLIAALCVGLIGILFMNLAGASALVRLAAAAGIFWLLFVFIMTAGDYLTR
jgi:cytochrome c oxidase subunit 4